jgi:hypothetical protein
MIFSGPVQSIADLDVHGDGVKSSITVDCNMEYTFRVCTDGDIHGTSRCVGFSDETIARFGLASASAAFRGDEVIQLHGHLQWGPEEERGRMMWTEVPGDEVGDNCLSLPWEADCYCWVRDGKLVIEGHYTTPTRRQELDIALVGPEMVLPEAVRVGLHGAAWKWRPPSADWKKDKHERFFPRSATSPAY